MKKLLLAVLLSTSMAFGCNDLPEIHNYKLDCRIDPPAAFKVGEINGKTFYKDPGGVILAVSGGVLDAVIVEYNFTYTEFLEKSKMMSMKYGDPLILDDAFAWKWKGVVIVIKYSSIKTLVTYTP